MTDRVSLVWDESQAADESWFLNTADGERLGWICVLNDWQGYVTQTETNRGIGKFETLEEAKTALEISARLRLTKEAGVENEWRSTMLGWQYHGDGEVCGWVVEDSKGYEAQILRAGQTVVLGSYATDTEAKAAVMAAQEETMARNTAHDDDGFELQEGEAMDEDESVETEDNYGVEKTDITAMTSEPEPEPAPRKRKPRSDAGVKRGPRKPKLEAPALAKAKATGKRGSKGKAKPGIVGGVLDQVRAIKAEIADHQKAIEECEGRLAQLREALTEALEEVGT